MKIAIGCDHIVTGIKNEVIKHLESLNHEVIDCGNYTNARTHYAIYGHAASVLVATKKADLAIVICGTGVGISNSANKTKNVRAVLTHNELVARKARQLYDANVLCIGGRVAGFGSIIGIIETFLKTQYDGGNKEMISKIDGLIKNENYNHDLFNEIIEDWHNGKYTEGEKQEQVDFPQCDFKK